MAEPARAVRLPAMLTPHRSSRVLLVASGRNAADAGPAPVVRRYRLLRVCVSPGVAMGEPRRARAKRPEPAAPAKRP